MKNVITSIFFLVLTNFLFSQNAKFCSEENVNIYFFGVRIVSVNNGIGQFYIVYAPKGNIENLQTISKTQFLNQAQGIEDSEVNAGNVDLFTKFGVVDSLRLVNLVVSSISPVPTDLDVYNYTLKTKFDTQVGLIAESAVNKLWKLRYAIYPLAFFNDDTLGWTNNTENQYMPKKGQMDILKTYGIEKINDYIWGDNLFRLLRDMENKEWVETYMKTE